MGSYEMKQFGKVAEGDRQCAVGNLNNVKSRSYKHCCRGEAVKLTYSG